MNNCVSKSKTAHRESFIHLTQPWLVFLAVVRDVLGLHRFREDAAAAGLHLAVDHDSIVYVTSVRVYPILA